MGRARATMATLLSLYKGSSRLYRNRTSSFIESPKKETYEIREQVSVGEKKETSVIIDSYLAAHWSYVRRQVTIAYDKRQVSRSAGLVSTVHSI